MPVRLITSAVLMAMLPATEPVAPPLPSWSVPPITLVVPVKGESPIKVQVVSPIWFRVEKPRYCPRAASLGDYETADIEQCHRLMPQLQRAAKVTRDAWRNRTWC